MKQLCARTIRKIHAGHDAERSDTRELVQLRSRGDREVAVEENIRRRRFRQTGYLNAQVVPPSAQQRHDAIQSCENEQTRLVKVS